MSGELITRFLDVKTTVREYTVTLTITFNLTLNKNGRTFLINKNNFNINLTWTWLTVWKSTALQPWVTVKCNIPQNYQVDCRLLWVLCRPTNNINITISLLVAFIATKSDTWPNKKKKHFFFLFFFIFHGHPS